MEWQSKNGLVIVEYLDVLDYDGSKTPGIEVSELWGKFGVTLIPNTPQNRRHLKKARTKKLSKNQMIWTGEVKGSIFDYKTVKV